MKKSKEYLPLSLMLGLGAAGAAVRGLLYLVAVDEKGLLARGHILQWVLLALSAAAVAAVVPVWGKKGSRRYEVQFSGGPIAAAGSLVMAVALAMMLLEGIEFIRPILVLSWKVTGLVSILTLVWAGISQLRNKLPTVLAYCALCLFLVLHLASRFQPWSGNPQYMDWAFSLLALTCLVLSAFHHAAFAADYGYRRSFLTVSLLAVFFCCCALPKTDFLWLYLGGGLWACSGLCRGKVPAEAGTPEETE